MRWIPFLIVAYLLTLLQSTLGRVLCFETARVGSVCPDLLSMLGVFVALRVRSAVDVTIACGVLGLGLDLTAAGGAASAAVVGPMVMGYVVAGNGVYRVREAFFRQRALIQALLAMVFCLTAHGVWVTAQSVLAYSQTSGVEYWHMLLQAGALAVYTAVLAPIGAYLLNRIERWLVPGASQRSRRR